jgi:hypothetical protein
MCMPEYLYGLILIDSLEGKSVRAAAPPVNSSFQGERETILAPRREGKSKEKYKGKSKTTPSGAGSLAPAGA